MLTFESEKMSLFISYVYNNGDVSGYGNCSLQAPAITSINDVSMVSKRIVDELYQGAGQVTILNWQKFDTPPEVESVATEAVASNPNAPLLHPEPGHIPMPK